MKIGNLPIERGLPRVLEKPGGELLIVDQTLSPIPRCAAKPPPHFTSKISPHVLQFFRASS